MNRNRSNVANSSTNSGASSQMVHPAMHPHTKEKVRAYDAQRP
jgi:hypothetical protein